MRELKLKKSKEIKAAIQAAFPTLYIKSVAVRTHRHFGEYSYRIEIIDDIENGYGIYYHTDTIQKDKVINNAINYINSIYFKNNK
jgi:hypothetical protein